MFSDKNIGQLIKFRRKEAGVTQQDLAEALGITYQQVQKYESGQNRIRASMLVRIAEILTVDLMYFYQDYERNTSLAAAIQDPTSLKLIELASLFDTEEEKESFLTIVSEVAKILSRKNLRRRGGRSKAA